VLEAPALVEAIWKQATQEELLLLQLDQMEGRCDALELSFTSFQEGGCYPFANLEQLAAVCVSEQAALDAMKASPYLPGVVGRYEQVRGSAPLDLSCRYGLGCGQSLGRRCPSHVHVAAAPRDRFTFRPSAHSSVHISV
jgi:hypothetical protein